jgi:hypothetical protein
MRSDASFLSLISAGSPTVGGALSHVKTGLLLVNPRAGQMFEKDDVNLD